MLAVAAACGGGTGAPSVGGGGDGGPVVTATPDADRSRYADCRFDATLTSEDGMYDSSQRTVYDSYGWPILVEDTDRYGTVDRRVWENDAFGNTLLYELYYDVTYAVEVTFRQTGEYDEDGNPVRVEQDVGDDGLDLSATYASSGGLLRTGAVDVWADGTVDERWSYDYDADDVFTHSEGVGPDGELVRTNDLTRWADTELPAGFDDVLYEDGAPAYAEAYRYVYDAQHRVTRYSHTQDPVSGGPVVTVVVDRAFDGDAQAPYAQDQVTTADGEEIEVEHFEYTYDEAWRLVERLYDSSVHASSTATYGWSCP